jgi:uncharacterized membrane protein
MPTIRLVELHPIIVHFPIALLIVGVLLDFLALFLRRAHLVAVASWCLGLGSLGLLAAELSGQLIEDHVNKALAGNILEVHKTFALMTVITFGTLFVLRLIWLSPYILSFLSSTMPVAARVGNYIQTSVPILGNNSRPLIGIYLLLSVGGIVLLAITGYLGGSMVYDHGVGTPSGMFLYSIGPL